MQGIAQRWSLFGIHTSLNRHKSHTGMTTDPAAYATRPRTRHIWASPHTMSYMFFILPCYRAMQTLPRTAALQRARGFTLLEVMVVVAIVAVLAAIAAPGFNPLIERWRVRQAVDGLQ